MLALLIPLAMVLCAAVALAGRGACAPRAARSIRDALALGGVLTALWAAAGAELLSLPHVFSFAGVLAWWLVPVAILAPGAWRGRVRVREQLKALSFPDARTILLLIPIIGVLSLTLVVALGTPPTTWDCLRYHLPRQVLWIQQQGVQHFPAHDVCQLEMPPLAEYIGAQLMILGEGDRGANMIQWSALLLCATVASAIARDLGAPRPGQAFAALMVVALPSAATQAVNAKNDIVLAFFALVLAQSALRVWNERECSLRRAAFAGVTLGLLLLTKGTGPVYGLPIGLFLCAAVARAIGWRCVPEGIAAAVIAISINAGHLTRNYLDFGNPLIQPRQGAAFVNGLHTPAAIASNLVRDLSLQLGTPWQAGNDWLLRQIEAVHRWLGQSPTDSRTTLLPPLGFHVFNEWPSDGNNPAPIHLVLGLVLLGLAIARRGSLLRAAGWPLYFIPAGAFLVFAVALTWQPWHNRLLIPCAMLVAPIAAAGMGLRWMNALRIPAAVLLSGLVWPPLLYNQGKALVGPDPIWKLPRQIAALYVEPNRRPMLAEAIRLFRERRPEAVGIDSNGWGSVYAFMRIAAWDLPRDGIPRPTLVIVNPNYGPPPRASEPVPDMLISWPTAPPSSLVHKGWVFQPLAGGNGFEIYGRTDPHPAAAPATAFGGWDTTAGLLPVQPPFPQAQLPAHRWALGPQTTLEFSSDGGPAELVVEGRSPRHPPGALNVALNGRPSATLAVGTWRDVVLLHTALSPEAGRNTLEIRYDPAPTAEGRPFLFQRLSIASGRPPEPASAAIVGAPEPTDVPASSEDNRARAHGVLPWLGLGTSLALLLTVGVAIARRIARPGPDRFWALIVAIPLQMGAIAIAASALKQFNAGHVLMLQTCGAAVVLLLTRGAWERGPRPSLSTMCGRDPVCIAIGLAVVTLLVLSGTSQALTPLQGIDERNYHMPRIAFWLQNSSLFPYATNNERQTSFPFGTELIAAWPLLFVKHEVCARLAFWLCLPLSCAGIWMLCRTIGAGVRASLAAVLLFAATPTVLYHSEGLKSDAWLPLFCTGAAYAAIRPRGPGELPGRRFLLAGVLLALAINVKFTALALLPGLVFAALLERRPPRIGRCVAGLAAGLFIGAAASGLGITIGFNLAQHDRPFGAPGLIGLVRSAMTPLQVRVYAARLPLFLVDFPEIPIEPVRLWLQRLGQGLAERIGATTTLQETPFKWPGAYEFELPPVGTRFSLGGVAWLPALAFAAIGGLRSAWRRTSLDPVQVLAIMQIPLLLGVVFMIRWMGGGPGRFWLGAYALSVPLVAALLGRAAARSPLVAALCGLGLIWTASPMFRAKAWTAGTAITNPATAANLDEPYAEVVPLVRPGSNILLVAGNTTREYGLFRPRDGFPNRIIPWGNHPFNADRMDGLLAGHAVTHIVIESDLGVAPDWLRGMPTRPFVDHLAARPDFREVPLRTPHMRLFQRGMDRTGRAP